VQPFAPRLEVALSEPVLKTFLDPNGLIEDPRLDPGDADIVRIFAVDDDLEIGTDLVGLDPTSDSFSIVVFAKLTGTNPLVRDHSSGGDGTFLVKPDSLTSKITFRIGGTEVDTGVDFGSYNKGEVAWVLTNNGDLTTLYANGLPLGSSAPGSDVIAGPLHVAKDGQDENFSTLSLQELRFYTKCLSPDMVWQVSNMPTRWELFKPVPSPTLSRRGLIDLPVPGVNTSFYYSIWRRRGA